MSTGRLVHHSGPDWDISTSIGWTAMKSCTDCHKSSWLRWSHDFSSSWPAGQNVYSSGETFTCCICTLGKHIHVHNNNNKQHNKLWIYLSFMFHSLVCFMSITASQVHCDGCRLTKIGSSVSISACLISLCFFVNRLHRSFHHSWWSALLNNNILRTESICQCI